MAALSLLPSLHHSGSQWVCRSTLTRKTELFWALSTGLLTSIRKLCAQRNWLWTPVVRYNGQLAFMEPPPLLHPSAWANCVFSAFGFAKAPSAVVRFPFALPVLTILVGVQGKGLQPPPPLSGLMTHTPLRPVEQRDNCPALTSEKSFSPVAWDMQSQQFLKNPTSAQIWNYQLAHLRDAPARTDLPLQQLRPRRVQRSLSNS